MAPTPRVCCGMWRPRRYFAAMKQAHADACSGFRMHCVELHDCGPPSGAAAAAGGGPAPPELVAGEALGSPLHARQTVVIRMAPTTTQRLV